MAAPLPPPPILCMWPGAWPHVADCGRIQENGGFGKGRLNRKLWKYQKALGLGLLMRSKPASDDREYEPRQKSQHEPSGNQVKRRPSKKSNADQGACDSPCAHDSLALRLTDHRQHSEDNGCKGTYGGPTDHFIPTFPVEPAVKVRMFSKADATPQQAIIKSWHQMKTPAGFPAGVRQTFAPLSGAGPDAGSACCSGLRPWP